MTARLSVVVPVYSGQDYLEALVEELEGVRSGWSEKYDVLELHEVIFVDDASVDGSPSVLHKLEAAHSWVHVVTLGKNFGQHPATMAGILHTSGDWVATLDEDLQHRPHALEALIRRAVTSGADVVYAQPVANVHGSWHRDLLSRLYKGVLARLAGNPVIARFNSFRVCRGSVSTG